MHRPLLEGTLLTRLAGFTWLAGFTRLTRLGRTAFGRPCRSPVDRRGSFAGGWQAEGVVDVAPASVRSRRGTLRFDAGFGRLPRGRGARRRTGGLRLVGCGAQRIGQRSPRIFFFRHVVLCPVSSGGNSAAPAGDVRMGRIPDCAVAGQSAGRCYRLRLAAAAQGTYGAIERIRLPLSATSKSGR